MKYVKISARVERRIKSLEQSDKAGKIIARKAENIIEDIVSGSVSDHTEQKGLFTKYGEKRLKYCRKYDFGCGYRLITIQKDSSILVPFLGTHDECDRWLETNNKSKHIGEDKGTIIPILHEEQETEGTLDALDYDIPDLYEDEPRPDISEQNLRVVFCGLVAGAKKRSR